MVKDYNLVCQICSKEFTLHDSWKAKKAKFCSVECKRLGQIGKSLSEECKNKIGIANKGKLLGRKRPLEVGKKISKSKMGYKYSEESRKKMSEAHKGKKLSKEHVQNMAAAHRNLPKKRSPFTCPICGLTKDMIPGLVKTRKYCSIACSIKGNTIPKVDKISLICTQCNSLFEVIPSLSHRQFCSVKCSGASRRGVKRPDKIGEKIRQSKKDNPNNVVFTIGHKQSEETRRKIREANLGRPRPQMRGENHHNWKGGTTPLYNQIRSSLQYSEWRRSIFVRDSFTCTICRKSRCWLEVHHHRKSFSDILHGNNISSLEDAILCKEFWDISNGITLCKECHNKTKSSDYRHLKDIKNFYGFKEG